MMKKTTFARRKVTLPEIEHRLPGNKINLLKNKYFLRPHLLKL
jgi:hypothetical protein